MIIERSYRCLNENIFQHENYRLIPIRDEDKYLIMKWRNEQIDILRQKQPIVKEQQESYFKNVVDKLFEQEQPNQLLFSFLENDKLIGYGGLVHIEWESKNAEVSFLLDNNRNNNLQLFETDFSVFLHFTKYISFRKLNFLKIHTTFYDIQKRHGYKSVIEHFGFVKEAEMKKHILINGKIENVLIYSSFNKSV